MKFLIALLRAFFPIFFKSKLDDADYTPKVISLEDILKLQPNFSRRHAFVIPYRTNGASRKKKSNRLRISKLTRNKHR